MFLYFLNLKTEKDNQTIFYLLIDFYKRKRISTLKI